MCRPSEPPSENAYRFASKRELDGLNGLDYRGVSDSGLVLPRGQLWGETAQLTEARAWLNQVHPYERWIESLNVPGYRGYCIENLESLKLGRWEDRGMRRGFLMTGNR